MRLSFLALLALFLMAGCTDRLHRNPLDPEASGPVAQEGFAHLESLAGDGEVRLWWDCSRFDDIAGFRLYRRADGGEFVRHPERDFPPSADGFVDQDVENGTTYEYRLALLVEGEGERMLDWTEQATPGSEVAWVADRTSGLVWKIAADGRSAWFAQGRFPSIEGLAVDRTEGAAWVTDRYFAGVYRIGPDGGLSLHSAAVGQAGAVAIDGEARRGWLVDARRREVVWFSVRDVRDTLDLSVVDAHFVRPVGLAAGGGGCWISDSAQGRILFYEPSGRRIEFRGLDRPGAVACAPDGGAWALVGEGRALVHLKRSGRWVEISLPFAAGADLDVDPRTGACWVVGEGGVASISPNGSLLVQWEDLSGGRALAVDGAHQKVWVAGDDSLWKLSMRGERLAHLVGFSGLSQVQVVP